MAIRPVLVDSKSCFSWWRQTVPGLFGSRFRFWGFYHDKEHFELCDGVNGVRDVGRKHYGVTRAKRVVLIGDAYADGPFDYAYECVEWRLVFAKTFTLVKREERDSATGVL